MSGILYDDVPRVRAGIKDKECEEIHSLAKKLHEEIVSYKSKWDVDLTGYVIIEIRGKQTGTRSSS